MTRTLIRQVRPDDAAALDEMWARCSPATRYGRFHAPVKQIPARYRMAVLEGQPQTLVAYQGDKEELIAVASLLGTRAVSAELGVLVEDRYQGQGLGKRLVAGLLRSAPERGITLIEATVLVSQSRMARRLAEIPGECSSTLEGPTLRVRVRLAAMDGTVRHFPHKAHGGTGGASLLQGRGA